MLVQHLIMAFRPYTTTCIAKNLIYCVNKVYTLAVAQKNRKKRAGNRRNSELTVPDSERAARHRDDERQWENA